MVEIVNQLILGILLGGLYALFAIGLSLSVGVIRLINLAHGDEIVLFSYLLLTLTSVLGLHPALVLLLLLPLAFGFGYLLQRLLLQRVVTRALLPALLVTFGLSIIIQNGLLETYGADMQKLSGAGLEMVSLALGPQMHIGLLPLTTLVVAIVLVIALDALLYRLPVGARIRAVADDPATASLIGLPTARIYAIAMGIITVTIAIAAFFMAIWTNFDPTLGPANLLVAFEVVVLGGLGSLWGTLVGGMILGVAQTFGAQFDAAWQSLAGHIVFLLIFLLRPRGLFPKS
jgi:branched-chain amino acid transport system permease protein